MYRYLTMRFPGIHPYAIYSPSHDRFRLASYRIHVEYLQRFHVRLLDTKHMELHIDFQFLKYALCLRY